MELENEIASNKFDDNIHKSVVNVIYTYGWVTNLIRQHLDKYNITMQQFNILRILRGQHPEPATVNVLKERMLDKMSDASRIVERLVQKGLVSRCTNVKDRRAVDIKISPEGLEILKKLDTEMVTKDLIKGTITDEEASLLSSLLDKMRG
ncbi:MAG: transcriptional regulator [Sphingobacteriales bacterium]|nr:transcriptional regulator [Sphingobacteriales bacterium]